MTQADEWKEKDLMACPACGATLHMPESLSPSAGMVMVSRKATEDMALAGLHGTPEFEHPVERYRIIWEAMISAALSARERKE